MKKLVRVPIILDGTNYLESTRGDFPATIDDFELNISIAFDFTEETDILHIATLDSINNKNGVLKANYRFVQDRLDLAIHDGTTDFLKQILNISSQEDSIETITVVKTGTNAEFWINGNNYGTLVVPETLTTGTYNMLGGVVGTSAKFYRGSKIVSSVSLVADSVELFPNNLDGFDLVQN